MAQRNKSIKVVPVVSASPDYAIDDVLGTKMTLTAAAANPGQGTLLQAITISSEVDIPSGVYVDVVIFDTNPSNSTFTDNGAIALNVADIPYVVTAVSLAERFDFGTPCILAARNIACPCTPASGGTLYAVAIVCGEATLNLAAVDDIEFFFHFIQD